MSDGWRSYRAAKRWWWAKESFATFASFLGPATATYFIAISLGGVSQPGQSWRFVGWWHPLAACVIGSVTTAVWALTRKRTEAPSPPVLSQDERELLDEYHRP